LILKNLSVTEILHVIMFMRVYSTMGVCFSKSTVFLQTCCTW